jgi:hypothetical protein
MANGTARSEPRVGNRGLQAAARSLVRLIRHHGLMITSLILLMSLTAPFTLGDTNVYVSDILLYYGKSPLGSNSLLWEFGHLLWRPFGWLLLEAGAPALGGLFHWNIGLLCTAILIFINVAAGIVTVLVWESLVLRITGSRAIAYGAALAFACANAFFAYMRSGCAYVVGLLFVTASVWIVCRASGHNAITRRAACGAGLMLAAAILFWLPYVLSVPGVVALGLRRQIGSVFGWWNRENIAFGAHLLGTFALSVILCLALVLAARRIDSVSEAKAWAGESDHGWSQNRRFLRIATGLPRGFLYFGKDGTLYKRFLWKDPYDPVSLSRLLRASLWKVALFYASAAALCFELLRRPDNHRALGVLLAGVGPTIAFAIFVFEPGSPERYLPVYPFLILAIAQVLRGYPRPYRLMPTVIALFLVTMAATNVYATYRPRIASEDRPSAQRVESLKPRLTDRDLVSVLSNRDRLYLFVNRSPFHRLNQPRPLRLYDVLEPANSRVARWRWEFAAAALGAWNQGGEVWVSKRLWAVKPLPEWDWVEGDDARASWKDIAEFFTPLQIAEDLGGDDGFFRLLRADPNESRLSAFARDALRDPSK